MSFSIHGLVYNALGTNFADWRSAKLVLSIFIWEKLEISISKFKIVLFWILSLWEGASRPPKAIKVPKHRSEKIWYRKNDFKLWYLIKYMILINNNNGLLDIYICFKSSFLSKKKLKNPKLEFRMIFGFFRIWMIQKDHPN